MRFRSDYDHGGLLTAVHEVLAHLGASETGASQRHFDTGRAAAGHPRLPTAKRICARLNRPWSAVVALAATVPSHSRPALLAVGRADRRMDISRDDIVSALRAVDQHVRPATLTRDRYEDARQAIERRARARRYHDSNFILPNANQIFNAAGDWAQALELAGLEQEVPAGASHGVSSYQPIDAIELALEMTGALPTSRGVEQFMRAQGLRLARRTRGHKADLELLRVRRVTVAKWTPPRAAPRRIAPDWSLRQPGAPEHSQRLHAPWTRDEVIAAAMEFLADLAPGQRATQQAYRVWAAAERGRPAARTVGTYGHQAIMDEARRRNRNARSARARAGS